MRLSLVTTNLASDRAQCAEPFSCWLVPDLPDFASRKAPRYRVSAVSSPSEMRIQGPVVRTDLQSESTAAAFYPSGRFECWCPAGDTRRTQSTVSNGSHQLQPHRERPASPPRATRGQDHASRWSQGSTSAYSRSRVVYQSRSTPLPASDWLRSGCPALVGEVLAPAVEPATIPPDSLDDRPDTTITATAAIPRWRLACRRGNGNQWRGCIADHRGWHLAAWPAGRQRSHDHIAPPIGTGYAAWAQTHRCSLCSGYLAVH